MGEVYYLWRNIVSIRVSVYVCRDEEEKGERIELEGNLQE